VEHFIQGFLMTLGGMTAFYGVHAWIAGAGIKLRRFRRWKARRSMTRHLRS